MVLRRSKILSGLFVFVLMAAISFASEEEVLNLSDFVVKSEGIDSLGAVQVTGTVGNDLSVTSLKIDAFGKEYNLSQEQLLKIPKGYYNGVQLSYEVGYKETGGKTVYIVLHMGFVSGVMNRVLVSLTESGNIEVEKIKDKGN